MNIYLGIDIGSISLNTVIMDENMEIVNEYYDYCQGQPFTKLKERLEKILHIHPANKIHGISLTGTGGKIAADLLGGIFVNEVIAQSKSISMLYPDVRNVIEIGGEDSKFIIMENDQGSISRLSDFQMNTLCAAGTGSFLDQQAKRIGVDIRDEFGNLALRSENPPRIAGRCSVFAKSDMIHLQQIATPVHDIVAGLCFAVARNFKSNLIRGRILEKPVVFQGGVAANAGVVRAFREILKLNNNELIVPKYFASMGAIGSVYYLRYDSQEQTKFCGLDTLTSYLNRHSEPGKGLKKLHKPSVKLMKSANYQYNGSMRIPAYLGVDVGSLSTNVVLIDDDNNVIARRYLPTASRPLEAIKRGLSEIYGEVGERVEVMAAGTTGSGRYLTGDFIGADVIRNEITAQATAAIHYDSSVDTIFEIGGQDSKYISIDKGIVVDFEMNKVCAAGTGSFLEEQAEKLNINIKEEFGKLALSAEKPANLGDRCTVFMESDLNSIQQKGEKNHNLIGGLAYSIVFNYIQKVVGNKRIGNKIFFQGGVANNLGVVAAFEKVTGKKITVPPHFDVTGAIGMAIIARENVNSNQKTRFKGFEVSKKEYTVSNFTCHACSNNCEIRKVKIEGEDKALFYGSRCEKYEIDERKTEKKDIPNLFEERIGLLRAGYSEIPADSKPTIGIPRALMVYYQQFPFWKTFFEENGFQVILSSPTDNTLVTKSLEILTAETCLPVEVVHGHVQDLLDKNVDHIFLPFIVNSKSDKDNPTSNCNCPWVQSYPFMVKAAFKEQDIQAKFLIPTLHQKFFETVFIKEMTDYFSARFNLKPKDIRESIRKADNAQLKFENSLKARGREILQNLPEYIEPFVLLGRPYNTGDPELNLSLVEKLIKNNVLPIPVDFLPIEKEQIFDDYDRLYWPNAQKIVAAARIVAKDPQLNAVYISNFRCGPDTFLSHYLQEELKGKPYLQLEVDEHSADAGMITRIEAYLDSVKGRKAQQQKAEKIFRPQKMTSTPLKDRILYFPYMHDGSHIIAAAARSVGIESYSLPMQDKQDVELGRKYTSSRECFPMICTTGSFLKKLTEPGLDTKKVSFFMPDHNGPCRFGQYNKLQKIIFERLGHTDVEIVSPSNDGSYEDIGPKFRVAAWKGFVALDLLKRMANERRPYELQAGDTEKTYKKHLHELIESTENGCKGIKSLLKEAGKEFNALQLDKKQQKPVIAVVGEIFMRDNPHCSGYLVEKLESLGAEVVMAPFSEWLVYSTYRYMRDSKWKKDRKGMVKAKIQQFSQDYISKQYTKVIEEYIDGDYEVPLKTMLDLCNKYIHQDYDGDPPIAIGTAMALAEKNISGIANILPFTCMPGTLICAVSDTIRHDHNNLPWIDIAYDGQDDVTIDTRLQAFMYQAEKYTLRIEKGEKMSSDFAWST